MSYYFIIIAVTNGNGLMITKKKPSTSELSKLWLSKFKLCSSDNMCQNGDFSCVFMQEICVFDPNNPDAKDKLRYDKMHG